MFPERSDRGQGRSITRVLREWHLLVLTVAMLVVLGLITEQFWYYWRTLA